MSLDTEVAVVAVVMGDVEITVMAVVVPVEVAVIPMQQSLVVVAIITTILMKQFPNRTQPAPFMMVIQPKDVSLISFTPCSKGLYCYALQDHESLDIFWSMISTVSGNSKQFTNRQYKNAVLA
jgi:hypothetical protein